MTAESSLAILPDPPAELKTLSARLSERIRSLIAQSGPIPFSTFMDMALYEPGLGYYSNGMRKFGSEGDFVTAPELGNVFSRCVANMIAEGTADTPDAEIIELGAGSGVMAHDIIQALASQGRQVRYRILERSGDLRDRQIQHLAQVSNLPNVDLEWLDQPPTEPWSGIMLANEVIDALSVERFQWNGNCFDQLMVDVDGEQFCWHSAPAQGALEAEIRRRIDSPEDALPTGYRSEVCTMLNAWIAGLFEQLDAGFGLFMDYGYTRADYYAPNRRDGTLLCHYRHRAHNNVFHYPGLQDITASVDFTALAQAGDAAGLEVEGYCSQAMFLLDNGLEEILSELDSMPDHERLMVAQQVRELTLPSAMGEKFQAMALAKNMSVPIQGFSLQDWRHRL